MNRERGYTLIETLVAMTLGIRCCQTPEPGIKKPAQCAPVDKFARLNSHRRFDARVRVVAFD
ncbi:MAG: prepilin-type N-terminal cleavage/methylation domain-containing protein, partial [Kluyvera intermedia]